MRKLTSILFSLALACLTAQQSAAVSATGGTVTNYTDGATNWTAHIFTNTAATSNLVFSVGGSVEVLMVAGGGGGGSGGGGAGGYVTTSIVVDATSYQVAIGVGGNGARGDQATKPGTGSNSVFGTITAYGGGYGGVYGGGADPVSRGGGNGGSGGGAGIHGSAAMNVGVATNGQGYNGGTNDFGPPYPGGGGGGAASTGFPVAGGGNGKTNSISGIAVGYAGGGGGGFFSSHADSTANCGGGEGKAESATGGAGTAGTGGGGGGSSAGTGGKGGSGIVIVRYVAGGAAPASAVAWYEWQPNQCFQPNQAILDGESVQ